MKNITFMRKGVMLILMVFISIIFQNSVYSQDQDGDGISQIDDLDDDNDGILDVVEGFGYNIYTSNCVGEGSSFVFNGNSLESGTALSAGAVYRFPNVTAGIDALVTIVSVTNATITSIDDDSIGIADAFQPGLTFDGVVGTPGAEFKIELVNSGMSTPLFIKSIGGVMSDVDGRSYIRESYIVKNVSGYAFSDPTTLTAVDLGGGLLQFESDGSKQTNALTQDSDLKVFFQNRYIYAMSITFQVVKNSTSTYYNKRYMSFYANECQFQTLVNPDVTITDLINFDGDGLADYLDRDADNDGIPDLVEAGGVDTDGDGVVDNKVDTNSNGYYDDYDVFNGGNIIADGDTDGDGEKNRVDLDADGDGITDVMESKNEDADGNGQIDGYTDTDNDGYSDNVDGDVGNDNVAENSSNSVLITGADTDADGKPNSYTHANGDANGHANFLDLDSDDDGIVDNTEGQLTSSFANISSTDTDRDGIDDSYDTIVGFGGAGIVPLNSDGSGNPDYLDLNSDYDLETDRIEAHDTNGDGVIDGSDSPNANTGLFIGADIDNDGIDDGYDNDTSSFDPTNSNLNAMSHPNFDGITIERDWREIMPSPSTIDFDGIDDYLDTATFINAWGDATLMAWVKLDNSFANEGFIAGQRMFNIEITSARAFKVNININNSTSYSVQTSGVKLNQWYHVTALYSGATSELKVYLNGEEVGQVTIPASSWLSNNSSNTDGGLSVGRYPGTSTKYFKGSIDEIRVFSNALTEAQIQQMVCQEIRVSGSYIRGAIIDKDIIDDTTSAKIATTKLEAYYPMTVMQLSKSTDNSIYGRDISLHNIETIQDQTAPMPYETKSGGDGNWANANNWLYGDVWDITGNHPDCAIVSIQDDLYTNTTHTVLGMSIDSGRELDVQNNAGIINTWFLKLDGKLDLNGESQLVQTEFSDLDVSSSGRIEIDQQGKADIYSYNHWSAPVNPVNTSANNTDYSIAGVLKDGTDPMNPQNINFISSGHNGAPGSPITLADYWMFKYVNQPDDYGNWFSGHVRSTGNIAVGEGYTLKGPGAATTSQNYVFEGKPNNARKASVDAMPGNDAVQLTIGGNNVYLVGNPFPSALDAHKFIDDNIAAIETNGDVIGSGTLTGALYFWDHWGGGSHALEDYQGGYATLNKAGATYAIPDPDVSGVDTSNSNKALPQRYIPVGQGFFIQGDPDGGVIEFNNSQRVFQREMDGNSTFVSTNVSDNSRLASSTVSELQQNEVEEEIDRVYFRFTTPQGPQRQLLLAVKEGLTEGIDYGYDAKLIEDHQPTDCAWMVSDTRMVIQSIGSIYNELELPLQIKVGNEGICKFEVESLADLSDSVNVYLVDKELGSSDQLEAGSAIEFYLGAGLYDDRFYLKFEEIPLAIDEVEEAIEDNLLVFYQSSMKAINISNAETFSLNELMVYNILGQQVYVDHKNHQNINELSINSTFSTGTYLVKFKYNDTVSVTRKVVVK